MNKCPHCNNPIIVPSAVKVTTEEFLCFCSRV